MKSIIVDDDIFFCKILSEFCQKCKIEVINIFHNALEAHQFLATSNEEIDCIFLDVHLPELRGFDLLKDKIRSKVVITTSDAYSAVEAFEHKVVDFLLKPVSFQRFLLAVDRIREKKIKPRPSEESLTSKALFVNINKRLVKLDISRIMLLEAKGNYVLIHINEGKNQIVHATLKKIFQKLPSKTFCQVHRSYIINIHQIIDVEDSSILIGEQIIPLSKSYRSNFLNRINLIDKYTILMERSLLT